MSKKVVIISSSLRAKSNSELLAKEVLKGANEAGHKVDFISLKKKEIKFCIGCLSCYKTLKCVIEDDVKLIAEKVKEAEVVVFATPIYYYELSGQLKTLLDRLNPLFCSDYKFREVYLITTLADTSRHASDIAINGLKGWISCFEKAKFCGCIACGAVNDPEEVLKFPHSHYLEKAYILGKNL